MAPPVPPSRVLSTFEIAPGFKIELAAAEPMIQAPIAGAFDADGRLWVVEMRTYMRNVEAAGELEPGNRIVVLEDSDGDGTFDRSRVFLDGLVLPRGVAPCFGGALVIEPPNLYFCKDTDGDGRADQKTQLLSGFAGRENPEHAGNGLLRGLDNWYHLAQHNLEFRFDGTSVKTRPTPTTGQWGIAQDDRGRLYYTPNSNALLADLYPKHYAARNPHQGGAAGIGELVAPDSTTWPARPTPGVNRGYQPNVLRPDGTLASLTAACGPVIYRADALGEDARGNAFICEAAGLLVKRLGFDAKAPAPAARNVYQGTEFLRSTDERFRPVNLVVAPDGSMYILDMHRGVIQHKTYVTPYLRDQIASRGLETPLDLGRIYRVTRSGAVPGERARLSAATNDRLLELLAHPDGWWRDAAQQLLVERHATDQADALRSLATISTSPYARLHAWWTLEGLGEISATDAIRAMADADPVVRAAGARIGEPFAQQPEVAAAVDRLLADGDRWVRVQAVLSAGESKDPGRVQRLVRALRAGADDKYLRSAALSGLADLEADMLAELLTDPTWPRSGGARALTTELADAALRAGPESRSAFIDLLGRLAGEADPRAEQLAGRLRAAQKLDSEEPKALALARPPEALLVAAQTKSPAAPELAKSVDYLDWPGRPSVQRASTLRLLSAGDQARFLKGQELYVTCTVCHQQDGQGSPGLAPALAGSPLVQGPEGRLARIILHGLEGKYTMANMEFDGAMTPPPLESDEDIAAVMTFVRRSWGNAGDPVSAAAVARARVETQGRTKAWTREELAGVK